MRRHDSDGQRHIGEGAGKDQGNAAAVVVTDQHRPLDMEGGDQGRQGFLGLVVHVARRARLGIGLRAAIAGPRPDDHPASG